MVDLWFGVVFWGLGLGDGFDMCLVGVVWGGFFGVKVILDVCEFAVVLVVLVWVGCGVVGGFCGLVEFRVLPIWFGCVWFFMVGLVVGGFWWFWVWAGGCMVLLLVTGLDVWCVCWLV